MRGCLISLEPNRSCSSSFSSSSSNLMDDDEDENEDDLINEPSQQTNGLPFRPDGALFVGAVLADAGTVSEYPGVVPVCIGGGYRFPGWSHRAGEGIDHQLRHPDGSPGGQDHDLLGVHR